MLIKDLIFITMMFATFSDIENDVGKLFVAWNSSTLASIETAKVHSKSKSEHALLQDAAESMILFWEIEDSMINSNSIRYQFLETIDTENVSSEPEWIIIEELRTGQITKYFNFLFIPAGNSSYRIIKYRYLDGQWHKLGEKNVALDKNDFRDNSIRKPYATVIASHKTIVSIFSTTKVKSSEFYLQTTFSDQSPLAKVLDLKY